jgi:hypothetical protein
MPQNIRTDIMAYVKLGLAAAFVMLKFHHGQELADADYFLIGALALGGIGNKISADAKTVSKLQGAVEAVEEEKVLR